VALGPWMETRGAAIGWSPHEPAGGLFLEPDLRGLGRSLRVSGFQPLLVIFQPDGRLDDGRGRTGLLRTYEHGIGIAPRGAGRLRSGSSALHPLCLKSFQTSAFQHRWPKRSSPRCTDPAPHLLPDCLGWLSCVIRPSALDSLFPDILQAGQGGDKHGGPENPGVAPEFRGIGLGCARDCLPIGGGRPRLPHVIHALIARELLGAHSAITPDPSDPMPFAKELGRP